MSEQIPNRRDFLQQAAVAAGGLGANAKPQAAGALLPTITLGKHAVTRLIVGGNPVYGYSHFNKLFSQHMTAWHTPERVLDLLRRCEQAGLNTFQNSYDVRTLADIDAYRKAGGRMNWLCLGKPDWDRFPDRIEDAARRRPIGIAPHGALAERCMRDNRLNVLQDLLRRIRDQGVLVGLSAHNPALIELAEERNWNVDYYMCCLYYLTRPRDEYRKLLGKDLPLGEIYLPSDPPLMLRVVQNVKKPCLVYKVLAAGRRTNTPAEVRQCFENAYQNIKPSDAIIVGMYQQFSDQVAENAGMVREICSRRG